MTAVVDVKQIVYALERQARALQEHADRLHDQLDYSAQFPAEDAERMREAIALLQAKPVQPYAGVMQGIRDEVDARHAARYRWLRSVPTGPEAARIVNDTPEGIDASIDAAMAAEAPAGRAADRPGDLVPLANGGSVDLAGNWKLPT